MSKIPYDARLGSVLRPANLEELPAEERAVKGFFSDTVVQALHAIDDPENREAALCAELSRLAYFRFEDGADKRVELESHLKRADLSLLEAYSESGTQWFAAEDETRVFVAFRGTETADMNGPWPNFMALARHKTAREKFIDPILDALADISFWKTSAKTGGMSGKMHGGFLRGFDIFHQQWNDKLADYTRQNANKTPIVCGHSLGAALATLTAAMLAAEHTNRLRLYTFGSPRVGDETFAASLAAIPHRRYVDCRDIVTRVPPKCMGFEHCGSLKYIDRHGNILDAPDCATIGKDRCGAFFDYLIEYKRPPYCTDGNAGFRGLADHAPINYVSALLGLR